MRGLILLGLEKKEVLLCDQVEFRMFISFAMLVLLMPAMLVWYRQQLLTFPFIELHTFLSGESAVIREFRAFCCREV